MKEINVLGQTGNLVYVCEYTVLSDYVITSMAKDFFKMGKALHLKTFLRKSLNFRTKIENF